MDLLADMTDDETEMFNERAAVREYLGGSSRSDAELAARHEVEVHRHGCEVRDVVRMYRTKGGKAVREYLLAVEKARGPEAAARLRSAALDLVHKD